MKVIVEINDEFETEMRAFAKSYGRDEGNSLIEWLNDKLEDRAKFFNELGSSKSPIKNLEWSIKPVD